ncbi:MAG: DNA-binding response regulator [Saprospirales bacterium]|nr:DNA-binding response regulator [Saprospirales bacterium]
MNDGKIKVLIADDHKLVRDGIKGYLESDPDILVVAEADNGDDAIDLLSHYEVDLLLLDINMPGLDGVVVAEQVKSKYPEVKVLALTMLNETQYVRQMLRAGAEGYLLKSCSQKELLKAIHTICEGETYFGQDVMKSVMEAMTPRTKLKAPRFYPVELTKREMEVLKLITREFTNQEIAEKLFISPRTVEVHKRNLIEKTGSKNIVGLVLYAVENGLDKD